MEQIKPNQQNKIDGRLVLGIGTVNFLHFVVGFAGLFGGVGRTEVGRSVFPSIWSRQKTPHPPQRLVR